MKKKHGIMVLAVLLLTNFISYEVGKFQPFSKMRLSMEQTLKLELLEKYVKDNYLREVDSDKFYTGQLKGIVESLEDPYSEYLTQEELKKMMEITSGSFYGVGVEIAPGEDDLITVVAPIKGSPADEAGVKTGDKILKVNGKDYLGKDMEEAVKNMKGEKGTDVTLTILTTENGTSKLNELTLLRDEIKLETIFPHHIGDLGYIGITQFNETTGADFKKNLKELIDSGIKGLILDLRGNPGGVVSAAEIVADELLPEGTIITSKNREGKTVSKFDSSEGHLEIPFVVLINGGSASASEIVAGAIKDFKAAKLIGEKSYGKGIIQEVKMFPSGDGLKLTVAEYFTPSGVNIHGIGIEPDIVVELPESTKGIGVEHLKEDVQLQRAIEELNNM